MRWLVIATLNRGALNTPEPLGELDSLLATHSLATERELGSREWTQRYTEVGRTPQEMFSWSA